MFLASFTTFYHLLNGTAKKKRKKKKKKEEEKEEEKEKEKEERKKEKSRQPVCCQSTKRCRLTAT